MNERLHRHLDGEVPVEHLEPAEREAADEWDRMVASFRTSAPSGAAPPWLEQRVMAEIDALPGRGGLARLLAWMVRPAQVRVPPLAVGLVAAGVALLLLVPRAGDAPVPGAAASSGGTAEAVVYVQFMLEAPTATSVAVAGDFNEWKPAFTLEDADGDGVWTGRVPVRPGVHGYMFLIDGTQWQTDPLADRYRDDGFGNRNAVLAVAAGA
jgi:hypothetical protein